LDIVFSCFFFKRVDLDGKAARQVIGAIEKTQWGLHQESVNFLDAEGRTFVDRVKDLLTVLSVEVLGIEHRTEGFHVPEPGTPPLPASDLLHPTNIAGLHEAIMKVSVVHFTQHAPLLLAWSYILRNVSDSICSNPSVHPDYLDFARAILPIAPSQPDNAEELRLVGQPLWQQIVTRCVQQEPDVFAILIQLSHSPILSSPTSNLGYLSNLRLLISIFPLLVHPILLPESKYEALLGAFERLYSREDAHDLRAEFVGDSASELQQGRMELLTVATRRFPIELAGTLRFYSALSSPPSEDLIDETSVEVVRNVALKFNSLATLTYLLPHTPPLAPWLYEAIDSEHAVRALQDIPVTASVVVPAGTVGRLVSSGTPKVVSWDMTAEGGWSGWLLVGDLLDEVSGTRPRRNQGDPGDVFGGGGAGSDVRPFYWPSDEQKEQDVATIFKLLRNVCLQDAQTTSDVLRAMSAVNSSPEARVRTVFTLLERALQRRSSVSSQIVGYGFDVLRALLPRFTGAIWTSLRASHVLFPSAMSWSDAAVVHPVLQYDKARGKYTTVLALLQLVRALVLEARRTSPVASEELKRIKGDVLQRAVAWTRNEVWVAFDGWRYDEISDKFEIAFEVAEIFDALLDEASRQAQLPPPPSTNATRYTLAPAVDVVLDVFTTSSTVICAPLLSSIASGVDMLNGLARVGRQVVLQKAEKSLISILRLTRHILLYRPILAGSSPCLLERLFFTHQTATSFGSSLYVSLRSGNEPVAALANYVTASVDKKLSQESCYILAQLSSLARDFRPNPPSLVGFLGGASVTESFVSSLLAIVSDRHQRSDLQIAVWDLISSVVDAQPGLALLFVTGRRMPVVPDEEQAKEKGGDYEGKPKAGQADKTAVCVAFDLLQTWKELDSRLLEAVLRFLDYAWQHLPEYGSALSAIRTKQNNWDYLFAIVERFGFQEDESQVEDIVSTHQLPSMLRHSIADTQGSRLIARVSWRPPTQSGSSLWTSNLLRG
jgi:nuclear pore complex protein Nup188